MRRMRAELISCASNTSAHGLPRIVTADRASLRTLWSLIYGTATLALLLHFSMLLHLYLQNAVTTSISYEAIPFEFPDVTVCSGSIYSVRLIEQHFREATCEALGSECDSPDTDNITFLEIASNFTEDEFRRNEDKFRLDIRQVILSCEYYGESCDMEYFTDFSVMKYRRREMCYTYKPPNRRTSPEIELGLFLAIYAENVDNLFSARLKTLEIYGTASYAGIRLVIHEPGCCPHASSEALAISSGSATEVVLKIEQIERLPVPKPDMATCKEEKLDTVSYCSDLDEPDMELEFNATTRDCQIRRMQEIILAECGCVSKEYPVPIDLCHARNASGHSVEFCQDEACVKKQLAFVGRKYEDFISKYCPNTCKQTTWYPKLGASIKWESADLIRAFMEYIDLAHRRLESEGQKTPFAKFITIDHSDYPALSRDFIELSVYPATHAGNKIVEKLAYPLESFVSEVGGILGLWIGSSVITFLEPLELICKAIENMRTDRFRRKKPEDTNNGEANDAMSIRPRQTSSNCTTLSIYASPVDESCAVTV